MAKRIVSSQKANQFAGWSIIGKLVSLFSFALKHEFKELFADTHALAALVDIEVENAHRLYLGIPTTRRSKEKVFLAHLEQPQSLATVNL